MVHSFLSKTKLKSKLVTHSASMFSLAITFPTHKAKIDVIYWTYVITTLIFAMRV